MPPPLGYGRDDGTGLPLTGLFLFYNPEFYGGAGRGEGASQDICRRRFSKIMLYLSHFRWVFLTIWNGIYHDDASFPCVSPAEESKHDIDPSLRRGDRGKGSRGWTLGVALMFRVETTDLLLDTDWDGARRVSVCGKAEQTRLQSARIAPYSEIRSGLCRCVYVSYDVDSRGSYEAR